MSQNNKEVNGSDKTSDEVLEVKYKFPPVTEYVLYSDSDSDSDDPPMEDPEEKKKELIDEILKITKSGDSDGVRPLEDLVQLEDIRVPEGAWDKARLHEMKEAFIGYPKWMGQVSNFHFLVPLKKTDKTEKTKSPGVVILSQTAWLRQRNLVPALYLIDRVFAKKKVTDVMTHLQAKFIAESFLERLVKKTEMTPEFLELVCDAIMVMLLMRDEFLNESDLLLFFLREVKLEGWRTRNLVVDLSLYSKGNNSKVIVMKSPSEVPETKRDEIMHDAICGEYFAQLGRVRDEIKYHHKKCLGAVTVPI